jgi:hypothetical protein
VTGGLVVVRAPLMLDVKDQHWRQISKQPLLRGRIENMAALRWSKKIFKELFSATAIRRPASSLSAKRSFHRQASSLIACSSSVIGVRSETME